MPETAEQFRERIRKIAEGRVSCPCSNSSWEQFIYIDGGADRTLAGCKRCGTVFELVGGQWTEKTKGPGRKD